MTYTEQYSTLKNIFREDEEFILIPESNSRIVNCNFKSQHQFLGQSFLNEDSNIAENLSFNYPIIIPNGKAKNNQAIIYLHGLNERSWSKHLYGAQYLAQTTGKSVIMFPLSYHINRGLPQWSNNTEMEKLAENRMLKYKDLQGASFFNAALSERFTEMPERFFASGYQSAHDIIALAKQIQNGDHLLFEKGTNVDFFSYSIGCFIVQTLMIAMPDNFFDKSKFVFFAGGSVFSGMNGVSKLILDSKAFGRIHQFYTKDLEPDGLSKRNDLVSVLNEQKLGIAFNAMLLPNKLQLLREKVFTKFQERMMFFALRDDVIMPLKDIISTIGENIVKQGKLKVLHFDYEYTHENPFPVLYKKISGLVDDAFLKVYQPAAGFLGS